MEYGETPPELNERLRDWNQTLKAFAFTMKPKEGNELWRAVEEHGAYERKPVYMTEG